MAKYKQLGTHFDRDYRNDLNANFTDIESDIKAHKDRVDTLINEVEQPSEVVDARGEFAVLRDRFEDNESQLAHITYQVTSFGAKGDGVQDEWDNIKSAIDYLKTVGGGELLFPNGEYRIGRDSGRFGLGGITIQDATNITITFAPNAVLLMDNLNESGEGDQSHGVYVSGDSSNLDFNNVKVIWKNHPSARSFGDGFRFDGNIDPNIATRKIKLTNCYVKSTPQAGCIFHGCKEIEVNNIRFDDLRADGLHFNACHGDQYVDGVKGFNVRDDLVALVTYYDSDNPDNPYVYNNNKPPFNSPDHKTRNNNKTIVRNVFSNGQTHANTVRLSGAYDVQIDGIISNNRKTGVIIDSAKKGGDINWAYLASRKITIKNVHSKGGNLGVHVEYFNGSDDWKTNDDFALFDVTVDGVKTEGSSLYSVYLERVKGIKLSNVDGDMEFRVRNFKDVWLDKINNKAKINIIGIDSVSYPLEQNLEVNDLYIGDVISTDNSITIEGIRKLFANYLGVKNSPQRSLVLTNVLDVKINIVDISKPNRSNGTGTNSRALDIIRGQKLSIQELNIEQDENNLTPVEVGGGGSTSDISKDIWLKSGTIRTDLDRDTSGIVVQGGDYKPLNLNIDLLYRNAGESSPKWRIYDRKESKNGTTANRPIQRFVGQIYYDTDLNKLITWNGSVWKDGSDETV